MARVFFDTRVNIDSDAISSATAYSLKQSDSGKTFIVTGAAQAVTLIPVANLQKGWNCKFIVDENTPSNAIKIAAGSSIIDMVHKDAGFSLEALADCKPSLASSATCLKYKNLSIFIFLFF